MSKNECIPESNLNVFANIYGCTLPESMKHLQSMGWKIVGAVQMSKSLSVITARTLDQHALMYARHGRICTINFGRPGSFTFTN